MQFISQFLEWIQIKISIHNKMHTPSFRERDVFWSSLGYNIGDEENGKGNTYTRPVLVIRKFNKNLLLGVPLSTKIKSDNPFYTPITLHNQNISAMISQLRVLDSKRLHKKIGTLDTSDFDTVQIGLRDVVFKNFTPTHSERGRSD